VSRFVRQETPPQFDACSKYLPFLRRDFQYRCAYCERTEAWLGGTEFFEIDHFRPASRFGDQVTHYPNLYYSCGKCNRHKGRTWPSEDQILGGFRFADPCQEDMYVEHFKEMPDGKLQSLNHCGLYTRDHIRLNRPDLLAWRRLKLKQAQDLQTLASAADRLEVLLLAKASHVHQDQIREAITTLKARIAADRQRFDM
jgi:hypothetical protein